MPASLDGLRVADLTTGTAGPLAAMMLADHGAEVIRVTPAGAAGEAAGAAGAQAMWNRNKSVVAVDAGDPAGQQTLAALVRHADVVLAGCDDAAITRSRLTELSLDRPRGATWIVLPPYLPGETPWAGGHESAGLLFAAMGHAWGQASYDDVPVDCAYPVVLYLQGLWAATVAVAAAEPGGRGGEFVVGGAHAAVLASPGSFTIDDGEPHAHRPGGPGGALPNYRCYRCRDGQWLFLGAFTGAFIRRGLEALGLGQLLSDRRLGGDLEAIRAAGNFPWVAGALEQVFAQQDREHWLDVLRAADVPVSPVSPGGGWLDHPQVTALGLRASLRDEHGAEWTMPGVPVVLSQTPGEVRHLARPAADLPDVLARWSRAARRADSPAPRSRPARSRAAGQPGALPLAGTRVIDFGTIIAGPLIGTMLASLGAEVVKVERPPAGDEYRIAHGGRGGAAFPAYNRGQRSIGLGLRSPGGREAIARLIKNSDVVVDNYRPGVAARLGLDWPTLRALNPAVSSVSVSAFGDAGPLGGRPGFDPVLQAMSGVMRTQGGPDESDSPAFLTIPVNDVLAATLGAFGACCALFARAATRRGQQVTVTLTAAAALLQAEGLVTVGGAAAAVAGGRDFRGPAPLSRLYPARDGWLRVDGRWPADAGRLAGAGLLPGWTGGEQEAGAALGAALAGRSAAAAVAALTAAGVPAMPAREPADLAGDASLRAHGLLRGSAGDGEPAGVAAGRWYLAADAEQPDLAGSPGFGEHTLQILGELGYSPADAEALRERGEAAGGPAARRLAG
jgi:crotonobetainyl-CoA:carnitine CoA-transferase CaiB-like acyl-CoA transferase